MKRETTRQRLDKILTEDREEINEPTKIALFNEFSRVAHEYFDTEDIHLNMKHGKNGTDVTVSFCATRIKNFSILK